MAAVETVVVETAVETDLAAFSLGAAVAVALWAYGVYCYVQMVRHRRPGVSAFELAWPPERLTPLGLEYRRRALRSYIAFAIVALLLILLGRLLEGGMAGARGVSLAYAGTARPRSSASV